MIEKLAVPIAAAVVVLAVTGYSVWRARRESTSLVNAAIANSNSQVLQAIETLNMTAATRNALEKVRDLLHEAGLDSPRPKPTQTAEVSERGIAPIREAFSTLLRDDDLTLLRQTLEAGQPVEDAGRALGLTPDQARTRFADALRRLCAFAEVAESQGFAANGAPAA
jgi:hypothetical protein